MRLAHLLLQQLHVSISISSMAHDFPPRECPAGFQKSITRNPLIARAGHLLNRYRCLVEKSVHDPNGLPTPRSEGQEIFRLGVVPPGSMTPAYVAGVLCYACTDCTDGTAVEIQLADDPGFVVWSFLCETWCVSRHQSRTHVDASRIVPLLFLRLLSV